MINVINDDYQFYIICGAIIEYKLLKFFESIYTFYFNSFIFTQHNKNKYNIYRFILYLKLVNYGGIKNANH